VIQGYYDTSALHCESHASHISPFLGCSVGILPSQDLSVWVQSSVKER